jgi:hypothetical protein
MRCTSQANTGSGSRRDPYPAGSFLGYRTECLFGAKECKIGAEGSFDCASSFARFAQNGNQRDSATGLLVCFLAHETLYVEVFTGCGSAVDVHGVRDDWTAAASVAGIAKTAF